MWRPCRDLVRPTLPLRYVNVVDLACGAAASIGRDLASLGAQVVRIEPRGGHHDRLAAPVVDGLSVDFAIRNLGKTTVELDLGDPADRAAFRALLADADVVIESTRPGSAEAVQLDAADIAAQHPTLVILSISDFGQAGAYARWQATSPVLDALSGGLARSGIPGRPPLLPPGNLAIECALVQAAYVALLGYVNRLKTGHGDQIDFSLMKGASQTLDPAFGIYGSATAGIPLSETPRGRPEVGFMYPIVPCADGAVRICVLAPRQWQGMFDWMGRPPEFADPSFNDLVTRFNSPDLIPAIGRFFADRTRADLEREGQRAGVPIAAVLDVDEVLRSDQMIARRAFEPVELASGHSVPVPNGSIEIDGVRAGHRPAHSTSAPAAPPTGKPEMPSWPFAGARPLSGLRVLDLGVIVVGAEQSRLLADQGAEVIKIENSAFLDGTRRSRDGSPVSLPFAAGHRNKRSLGINLRDERGNRLFLKLVAQSDVVMTNFKPGTMDSLGLGYEVLNAANPGIIVTDSSAFGPGGPWSKRLGYGPLVRASAGLTEQWRYPGEADSFGDASTIYPDHVAGRVAAIGVLALLIRRLHTGRGGTVSVSQAEIILSHQATDIAARALTAAGAAGGAMAEHVAHDAPWGVFPAMGDDEWCVVTVRSDEEWRALCSAMGRPELAAEPELATRAGRDQARARVDARLSDWLATRTPHEAMETLQAAGVPAAAMLRVQDLRDFPLFQEQGFHAPARHPLYREPLLMETGPARFSHVAEPALEPAPSLGEHTRDIARTLLDLSETEIEKLIQSGVLEEGGRQ